MRRLACRRLDGPAGALLSPSGRRRRGAGVTGTPQPGQLVYSRAGRDAGLALVVLAVSDARHVLVTDGRLRPGSRPKRKNVRHLDAAGAVHPGLAAGQAATDAELRHWIATAGARASADRSREGQA